MFVKMLIIVMVEEEGKQHLIFPGKVKRKANNTPVSEITVPHVPVFSSRSWSSGLVPAVFASP